MKRFMLSEKYRLEIHWDKALYETEQVAKLKNCYLFGPAIKDVWKLQEEDFIDLDFVNQYVVFIDRYYIVRLIWKGVKYSPEKIFLNNAELSNQNLNVVPKLNKDDYILIDTRNHENEKHAYNLVYASYLLKKDGTFYDFRSMV